MKSFIKNIPLNRACISDLQNIISSDIVFNRKKKKITIHDTEQGGRCVFPKGESKGQHGVFRAIKRYCFSSVMSNEHSRISSECPSGLKGSGGSRRLQGDSRILR